MFGHIKDLNLPIHSPSVSVMNVATKLLSISVKLPAWREDIGVRQSYELSKEVPHALL